MMLPLLLNCVRFTGTGIGWQSSSQGKSGCVVPLAVGVGVIGTLLSWAALGSRLV